MTDESGSTFAHKLAAVSLVIVGTVVALIAHYALSPDAATLQACMDRAVQMGGGQAPSCGTTASYGVPLLIMVATFTGASRVWR